MGIETPELEKLKPDDGPDQHILVFDKPEKDKHKPEGINLFPSNKGENIDTEAKERRQNLEKVDQALLVQVFKDRVSQLRQSSYQIETSVSGEKYTFSLENFYQDNEVSKDDTKLIEKLEQNPEKINRTNANFSCVQIEGRAEKLNLNFKVGIKDLLSGSTNIAEKIRQTFAGTDDHYRKIYQNKEHLELTNQQKELRVKTTEEIEQNLQEKHYNVSVATYEGGPVIISAHLPEQSSQIVISSMDGAIWSLSTVDSGGKSTQSQMGPSEVIGNIKSGEL